MKVPRKNYTQRDSTETNSNDWKKYKNRKKRKELKLKSSGAVEGYKILS